MDAFDNYTTLYISNISAQTTVSVVVPVGDTSVTFTVSAVYASSAPPLITVYREDTCTAINERHFTVAGFVVTSSRFTAIIAFTTVLSLLLWIVLLLAFHAYRHRGSGPHHTQHKDKSRQQLLKEWLP